MISLINTETKRRMENSKIQVLKDRYLLEFHLKIFFINYCQSRKCYLIISSVEKIIIRNRNIVHCSIIEVLDVYGMINCDFLISHNCNYYIKESIPLSLGCFCSMYSIREFKTNWTIISMERNIEVIFFKKLQVIGWWN